MFLFIHNSHTEYHKIIKPKSFNYMTESEFSTDYNDTITSETDLNLLEFNMTTYFKNLSTYFPKNSYGSCGYVTFIQCLSYYDTFLNDLIIPENMRNNKAMPWITTMRYLFLQVY